MRSAIRLPGRSTLLAATLLALAATFAPAARGQDANAVKARAPVGAAINMTDSDQAVKLRWQATDIDPGLEEAYVYLVLFYNSRSDFAKVIEVYKKLAKYEPRQPTVYLNIGEAYMSFVPPKLDDALTYYRKAYQIDPSSSFAALRIGEILAQQGNRSEALKFLRQASADGAHNPNAAAEANKLIAQMGPS